MSLELTIRDKIIRELVETLESYTWESMEGPAVHKGRRIFDPTIDPPPLITVLPRQEENALDQYGDNSLAMVVDLVCMDRLAGQNPSELGEAILGEAVIAVFGKERLGNDGKPEKYGGLTTTWADSVYYRTGGIDAYPDELGEEILKVGITIIITYQTNKGDPYNNQ